MTVTQRTDRPPGDPVPLAECVAGLLERSAERDASLALRLAAWREGYLAGIAAAEDCYSAGYAAAIADVKHAEHGLVRLFRSTAGTGAARWRLRGEARTRETFSQPHPGDYRGGAA